MFFWCTTTLIISSLILIASIIIIIWLYSIMIGKKFISMWLLNSLLLIYRLLLKLHTIIISILIPITNTPTWMIYSI